MPDYVIHAPAAEAFQVRLSNGLVSAGPGDSVKVVCSGAEAGYAWANLDAVNERIVAEAMKDGRSVDVDDLGFIEEDLDGARVVRFEPDQLAGSGDEVSDEPEDAEDEDEEENEEGAVDDNPYSLEAGWEKGDLWTEVKSRGLDEELEITYQTSRDVMEEALYLDDAESVEEE